MLDCWHPAKAQIFVPFCELLLPLNASACIVVEDIPATNREVIATIINKKDMFFM